MTVLYIVAGFLLWIGVCVVVENVWGIELAGFTGKALGVVFMALIVMAVVGELTGFDPLHLAGATEELGPGDKPEDCNPVVSGGRC